MVFCDPLRQEIYDQLARLGRYDVMAIIANENRGVRICRKCLRIPETGDLDFCGHCTTATMVILYPIEILIRCGVVVALLTEGAGREVAA